MTRNPAERRQEAVRRWRAHHPEEARRQTREALRRHRGSRLAGPTQRERLLELYRWAEEAGE